MSILSRVLLGAVLLLTGIAVWQRGTVAQAERARDNAKTAKAVAEQERDNAIAVIAVERQRVKRADTIAAKTLEEMRDAESKGAAVADGLRSRAIRLQDHWEGCEARVSGLATASSQSDANAESREQGASDLVRLAAEYDAWVRGLQALVRADRE